MIEASMIPCPERDCEYPGPHERVQVHMDGTAVTMRCKACGETWTVRG